MLQKCKTKYPIMLIHGIGYNDDDANYWGRIPSALRVNGAKIYFGRQEPFGGITENAMEIKRQIEVALEETSSQKINLIAHSKGGIEGRYLISKLGIEHKVASLTTMATPHRGVKSIDELRGKNLLITLFNIMMAVDNGRIPKDNKIYDELSEDYMSVFNEMVPNVAGVYYQSFAFDMKNIASHKAMGLFYEILEKREGMNDGLVSVESAKWGNFQGVITGPGDIGISHAKAVDCDREPLTHEAFDGGIVDITDFYIQMVASLKAMGY